MIRRNTIQKELVLQTVRGLRKHVSADEVYEEIAKEYPSIGKGTVYRNLNILADEGQILRVEVAGGADRYDFTLEEHYHVQCVVCHKVFDVDMEVITNMLDRIRDCHGIKFLGYNLQFKGICPDCQDISDRHDEA